MIPRYAIIVRIGRQTSIQGKSQIYRLATIVHVLDFCWNYCYK